MKNTSSIDRHTEKFIAIILVALAFAVIVPKTRETAWQSANTKSRIAVAESMVHYGTFSINKSPFSKTMDRIKVNGKLYSSKPPMLSALIGSVYFVLYHVTGVSLQVNRNHNTAHVLLALIFGSGSLLLMLFSLFHLLGFLVQTPEARLFTLGAVAFAFFGAGYAVDVNNHLAAAGLGMAAIACVVTLIRSEALSRRREITLFVFAGLFMGLLPTVDIPSAPLSIGLAIWLYLKAPQRTLKITLPIMLVIFGIHFWLTWQTTGGLLPPQLRPELWEKRAKLTGEGKVSYIFNALVGHHGVLSMVPLLIPAFMGLNKVVRGRDWRRPLGLIVVTLVAMQMIFYFWRTQNYGGTCIGFRWFIPATAWTLVFLSVFIDRFSRPFPLVWAVLLPMMFAVGTANTINAAQNPWAKSWWYGRVVYWGSLMHQSPAPKRPLARTAAARTAARTAAARTPVKKPTVRAPARPVVTKKAAKRFFPQPKPTTPKRLPSVIGARPLNPRGPVRPTVTTSPVKPIPKPVPKAP